MGGNPSAGRNLSFRVHLAAGQLEPRSGHHAVTASGQLSLSKRDDTPGVVNDAREKSYEAFGG